MQTHALPTHNHKSQKTCSVLLTGFGPFPGVPHNISAHLAEQIGADIRKRFPSSTVITEALPTEWDVAPERASDLICDLRPNLALHFGVSDQARGFVIETIARNQTGRVDAAGLLPEISTLDPMGPPEIATGLPAGRLNARLQRLGLPSELSRDAGTYLCNAVFYRSALTQCELGGRGRSGFIHLPVEIKGTPRSSTGALPRPQNRACHLDFESARRGGIEIVAACLNQFNLFTP